MNNYIPKYLVQKTNVIMMVLGTALFAEIFLTVYQPFGSRKWLPEGFQSGLIYFGLVTLVVLVAMGVIAISRTIMYKRGKTHEITYWQYAVWIIAEVLAMATIYTVVVTTVYAIFPYLDNRIDFLTLLGYSVLYTLFILFIPYAVFILYFSLNDKKSKLANLSSQQEIHDEKTQLNFYDEKGDFGISIRPDNLFYVAAADNYVDIVYKNSGKIRHFMLRQTLKNIEEHFAAHNLIRCHRSYIVNIPMVKILRRTDDGLELDFDFENVKNIPVSKSYSAKIVAQFSNM